MAEIAELNKQLLASNQPGNHHPLGYDHDPPPPPEPYTPEGMKKFVQTALSTNGGLPSNLDLLNVLSSLKLDYEGRVTNMATKTNFIKGMSFLCDFHFSNYNEHEQADIRGELFFNFNIFSKQAFRKLFEKSNWTMISCIFSDVSLLKAIESETGSLDDFAANEYAKIERDANLSSPPRGKTMLQTSHNITRACKILYGLVARLFSIEVNDNDPLV